MRLKEVKSKIEQAPFSPGIYLMKSLEDKIIYVGKAKNLRARLRSYFIEKGELSPKVKTLVSRIHDVSWIITSSELEALMLECTLIKKYRPRYNIHFRDDKSYPFLRVSIQEKWPQLSIVRRPKRDAAHYFGPYTSAYSIRETLRLLTKIFPIRDCSPAKFNHRTRPCISYDIGICSAPCVGYVSEAEYRRHVNNLIQFLKGKNKGLLQIFKKEMKKLSLNMKYEEAAGLRDRILAIENLLEKQRVVSLKEIDQDVIGVISEHHRIELVILFIRSGQLLGKKNFSLTDLEASMPQFLSHFIRQYYDEQFIPDSIVVPCGVAEKNILERFLTEKRGKMTCITEAKKGEKRALVEMANQNARDALCHKRMEETPMSILTAVQKTFHLKREPHRIECFDISNFQGTDAVGSRVAFIEGERDTQFYRRYKIKTVVGPNDPAMMYEVLFRRFKHEEKEHYPDLLMVDGGKSQLSAAVQVLKELNIHDVDVIGLAKEKTLSAFEGNILEKLEERVYLPGQKNPIILKAHTSVLHLLQRVRDEAHRFAIAYHKKIREKGFIS